MADQILRSWTGVTSRDHAAAYLAHLDNETVPHLRTIDGFLGIEVLRRDGDDAEVHFVVQTRWTDMDAIRAFAGPTLHVAVVPPAARELLLRFDQTVLHHSVALRG